jgi:hypothetical protein
MRQFVAALDPKKPAAVKWVVPKERQPIWAW